MVNWLQRQLKKGEQVMDDVLSIVRSALPQIGSETTYAALHASVVTAGKREEYLPGAIAQLKDAAFLRKEVARRPGDVKPIYRLIRTGA